MVSTSTWNAGGPWFDSRSRNDRFLYANSVCLYLMPKPSIKHILKTSSKCICLMFVILMFQVKRYDTYREDRSVISSVSAVIDAARGEN